MPPCLGQIPFTDPTAVGTSTAKMKPPSPFAALLTVYLLRGVQAGTISVQKGLFGDVFSQPYTLKDVTSLLIRELQKIFFCTPVEKRVLQQIFSGSNRKGKYLPRKSHLCDECHCYCNYVTLVEF